MYFETPCLDALIASFADGEVNEQVRVLAGKGTGTREDPMCVESFVVVPNRSQEPVCSFVVNVHDVPQDVLPRIVGVAHTHPVGRGYEPSYADVLRIPVGRLGIIWTPGSRAVTFYSRDGYLSHTTWRRRT